MPDTYGVTPADIAEELPGLFPGGFSATSVPSTEQVAGVIAVADIIATMEVQDVTGTVPAANDKAAALARRYIIEYAKAWVQRVVYAGNDPERVAAAAAPHAALAKEIRSALVDLGAQAVGTGEAAPRIAVPYTTAQRDLVLYDEDLDFVPGIGPRRF